MKYNLGVLYRGEGHDLVLFKHSDQGVESFIQWKFKILIRSSDFRIRVPWTHLPMSSVVSCRNYVVLMLVYEWCWMYVRWAFNAIVRVMCEVCSRYSIQWMACIIVSMIFLFGSNQNVSMIQPPIISKFNTKFNPRKLTFKEVVGFKYWRNH